MTTKSAHRIAVDWIRDAATEAEKPIIEAVLVRAGIMWICDSKDVETPHGRILDCHWRNYYFCDKCSNCGAGRPDVTP